MCQVEKAVRSKARSTPRCSECTDWLRSVAAAVGDRPSPLAARALQERSHTDLKSRPACQPHGTPRCPRAGNEEAMQLALRARTPGFPVTVGSQARDLNTLGFFVPAGCTGTAKIRGALPPELPGKHMPFLACHLPRKPISSCWPRNARASCQAA